MVTPRKRPACPKRRPSAVRPKSRKRAARRQRNPDISPASKHDPMTVYLFARGLRGRPLEVLYARHDGTVAGIRRVADALQGIASDEFEGWSMAGSQIIATDARGRSGWAISPNLAHISPVGTDAAAYTLGGAKKAPTKRKALPKKRALS